MNYITEINAFYVWLVENPISGNAQALWHRLMAYCNAFGWKEIFTITNGRLVEDLDISRQELDRVRNLLCQKGLIIYTKGSGNQCGTYSIISFASQERPDCVQTASQESANPVTQSGHNPDAVGAQPDTQPGSLDKLNETKLNETKKEEGSSEPLPGSLPADENPDIFISFLLNDGTEYDVTVEKVNYYAGLYPAVNIEQELRDITGWCFANKDKRKTRRGAESFINRWFAKTQNMGGSKSGNISGNHGNNAGGEAGGSAKKASVTEL